MKKFDFNVKEHKLIYGGNQWLFEFKNGYGASVISHQYSYGGDRGLYELAILDKNGLCYDTPITDDVIGYLTSPEVTEYLKKIQSLKQND